VIIWASDLPGAAWFPQEARGLRPYLLTAKSPKPSSIAELRASLVGEEFLVPLDPRQPWSGPTLVAIDEDPGYAPGLYFLCRVLNPWAEPGHYNWDTRDEDNTVLIQCDQEYPGIAELFGFVSDASSELHLVAQASRFLDECVREARVTRDEAYFGYGAEGVYGPVDTVEIRYRLRNRTRRRRFADLVEARSWVGEHTDPEEYRWVNREEAAEWAKETGDEGPPRALGEVTATYLPLSWTYRYDRRRQDFVRSPK
jgi:hypothetical protein